jgi:hypothetical protein
VHFSREWHRWRISTNSPSDDVPPSGGSKSRESRVILTHGTNTLWTETPRRHNERLRRGDFWKSNEIGSPGLCLTSVEGRCASTSRVDSPVNDFANRQDRLRRINCDRSTRKCIVLHRGACRAMTSKTSSRPSQASLVGLKIVVTSNCQRVRDSGRHPER